MPTGRIFEPAGPTDTFFYTTDAPEEQSFRDDRLILTAEIIAGRNAGETVTIEWIGSFDIVRGEGSVSKWRERIDGELHFELVFDAPVDVTDILDDLEDAFSEGFTFRGNRFANKVGADAGDDTMFGGGGDDALFGLAGDDAVAGGGGDDILSGGAGDDLVRGGAGENVLFGGSGNDVLDSRGSRGDDVYGGRGDDRLKAGGDRRDRLDGGSGEDLFIFAEGGALSGAERDVIVDFDPAADAIRVLGTYSNASGDRDLTFAFIGDAAFTGDAGQVRYNGRLLLGDADGDAETDFRIRIANRAELTEDNFLA